MRRAVLALLGVAAGFVVLVVWLGLDGEGGGWKAFGVFAGVLAAGFPVLYRSCRRQRWEVWRFPPLGALCGGLCALPFYGGPFGFGFLLLILVLAGMLFGLLFWLAAVWRNDDLTCPKSFCLPCGTVYRVARGRLFQSK